MAQMMPAPVTAMRVLRSGARTGGREVEPPLHDLYSIHVSDPAASERAAERRFRLDCTEHWVYHNALPEHLAAVDSGQKPLRFEDQPAGELRHGLDGHHPRRELVICGADVDGLDGLLVEAAGSRGRAKRDLV